jgi:hypothetical protein
MARNPDLKIEDSLPRIHDLKKSSVQYNLEMSKSPNFILDAY